MTWLGVAVAAVAAFFIARRGGAFLAAIGALAGFVAGTVAVLIYANALMASGVYAEAVATLGEPIAREILNATTLTAVKAVAGVSIGSGLAGWLRRRDRGERQPPQ